MRRQLSSLFWHIIEVAMLTAHTCTTVVKLTLLPPCYLYPTKSRINYYYPPHANTPEIRYSCPGTWRASFQRAGKSNPAMTLWNSLEDFSRNNSPIFHQKR